MPLTFTQEDCLVLANYSLCHFVLTSLSIHRDLRTEEILKVIAKQQESWFYL